MAKFLLAFAAAIVFSLAAPAQDINWTFNKRLADLETKQAQNEKRLQALEKKAGITPPIEDAPKAAVELPTVTYTYLPTSDPNWVSGYGYSGGTVFSASGSVCGANGCSSPGSGGSFGFSAPRRGLFGWRR